MQLAWGSRKAYHRSLFRTSPIVAFALFCIGIFTLVTYFLPTISTAVGNEVLLIPGTCGIIDYDRALNESYAEYNSIFQPYSTQRTSSAVKYADQCYNNTLGSLDCGWYVTNHLPTTIDNDADCPFDDGICRVGTNNLYLSTGLIDTHDYFGINRPVDDRVLFNTSLHCSPLITEGYTTTRESVLRNFTRYHYGTNLNQHSRANQSGDEGVFEIEDTDAQYNLKDPVPEGYTLPWKLYQLEWVS